MKRPVRPLLAALLLALCLVAAAVPATAASTALPPSRSTSRPAAEASRSTVAIAPPVPTATGCLTGWRPADAGAVAVVRQRAA
ncbi:MAG TPA: hypothetical protein VJ849_07055, partial [Actinomycetes bacterium]|nr:hypothetical protein [Actinomycetes bacterium]